MGQHTTANLRTVALVGHGSAGKTTLAESLLVASGALASRGAVEKGNTVCDFDPQEKELGHSLNSAVASFDWQGVKVHLVDTPGYPDFAGQAISALAASHIAKNSCIYLDAGTTTLALARAILDRNDLQVVTNDFEITQLLIDASQCGVIHTGGTLCRENRSCVGESAARTLRHLAIDTAFISASGWDSRGIFTPDENKVTVKETVSQVSARSILLCDSSKYNQVATFMALPLTRFTTIITDRHLSDAAASHIARHACEVLRAG